MNAASHRNSEISDILRQRVCLSLIDAPAVLHESALAAEFRISRTPIRQILQALAMEGMVEVRPGVGSVATQLNPGSRAGDMLVFTQFALAAANCVADPAIAPRVQDTLGQLEHRIAQVVVPRPEDYAAMYCRIVTLTSALADDEIAHQSLRMALWRVARWRTLDFRADPRRTWSETADFVTLFRATLSVDSAPHLLRTIAAIGEGLYRRALADPA